MIGLTGDGPTWTAKQLPDVTQFSGLDGGSAGELVHPPGYPKPAPTPSAPGGQPERPRPPVTGGYPRAARAHARRRREPSSASGSTPTRARCRPGSRPTPAGSRRSRGSSLEACLPLREPRSRPTWPSSRRSGRTASPPSSGSAAASRRTCRSSPTPSAATSARRRRARRSPCTTGSAADAITANPYLGSRRSRPLLERDDRFVYVLCRTSNPGAGELQELTVAAAADDAPAEPLFERVARRVAGLGPGRDRRARRRRDRSDEMARVRAAAPGLAFLVPGVGAQGGAVEPVLRDGPASGGTGRRRRPAAGSSSTYRGRSPGAARRARERRPWRIPAGALASGCRRLGQTPPCATVGARHWAESNH